MVVRRAVSCVGAALLVAACASSGAPEGGDVAGRPPTSTRPAVAPPTTTTTAAGRSRAPARLEWSSCGDAVECADLTVPLDHDEPDGATITLAVARRPARDPDRRIGVLAVNPGGPGASGVDLVRNGFGSGTGLDERFDIVSWDPRGVGASTSLTCGGPALDRWLASDPSPDDRQEEEALDRAAAELADACGRIDGDLLAEVGTDATVADLDLLRVALGEEQLSYLGLSYGTYLGQLYLEAHPDRVRALALDGVMDPARDLADHARAQGIGFERALEAMAAWCTGEPSCPLDDPLAAYDEVARRVEERSLPAAGVRPLGPGTLPVAAAAALYDEGSWPALAAGLAAALEGDASTLAGLADRYFDGASFTAYAAVVCSDFGPPDRDGFHRLAGDLARELPRFGAALAHELLPCAFWPVPPQREPAPVVHPDGAPPVLLLAVTGDPATPFAYAEAVADRLEGRLVAVEGTGHIAVSSSPCAAGHLVTYLVDLELPPPDTRC